MALVTVRFVKVPTEVRLDAVTPAASVFPVSVPAAAVTVISAVPSNATPLIFRAVASLVAVEALPVNVAVSVPETVRSFVIV